MTCHSNPYRVHLLTVGALGEAIARYLSGFVRETICHPTTDVKSVVEAELQDAALIIVASWRPVPRICIAVDSLAQRIEKPFLPVIVDTGKLQVGPTIIPGCGTCWTCWNKRSRVNCPWPVAREAIMSYYDDNPECGPAGYLDSLALVAAAKAAAAIALIKCGEMQPGALWQFDLATQQMNSYVAVGMHDCKTCGLHLSPESRTVQLISRDAGWLWNK